LIFLTRVVFGQLDFGTYRISSDTFYILTGRNFSELEISKNKSFVYTYQTSLGCLLWYDLQGAWETEKDQLILTDTVTSFHPIVGFVKNMDTDNDKISINVRSKDNKPMGGVKIKYLFKNAIDTLTGVTDENGNLSIDTENIKIKHKETGKMRVIDDVELWIVHTTKQGQDQTANNFSTLSSEIECVIDDNAVNKKVRRTTIYKIEKDNLIFQSQSFGEDDARPGGYLYGNFRLVKE
jgi:hypothetical protein